MGPLPPSAFHSADPVWRKDIEAWVNHGVLPPTIFLTAVLRGDLKAAFKASTQLELSKLLPIIRFLESVEERCWGSGEAVGNWMHDGGLAGKAKKLKEYEDSVAKRTRRNLPPTQEEIEDDGKDV